MPRQGTLPLERSRPTFNSTALWGGASALGGRATWLLDGADSTSGGAVVSSMALTEAATVDRMVTMYSASSIRRGAAFIKSLVLGWGSLSRASTNLSATATMSTIAR